MATASRTVSADITAAGYLFRASGYVVTFDGFTTLYEEATDEKEKKETALPPLEEGMVLKLRELKPEQKFTQPPARYTEATLIKALEGKRHQPSVHLCAHHHHHHRPAIMWAGPEKAGAHHAGRVMIQRADAGAVPQHRGREVLAHMEELDTIENGKTDWHEVIDDFTPISTKRSKEAEVKMEGRGSRCPMKRTGLRAVRPENGHQKQTLRQIPGLPGLPRMQKHQAPCEGHRRPVPQVRQPHAGAPFQKGPCVLRLREKPHLRLYDMERAHHRKMPMRFHPVQKGRKERYPAVRKRGLRLLPRAGCRKKE